MTPPPETDRKQAIATQTELDGLVVTIELTLISIIQGVALSFLTQQSLPIVLALDFRKLPFVAAGLVVIMLFWSRALLHTLTVIRYPLELGHNFMYVVCTFVEAVLFTQVADPLRWYAVGAVFAGLVWALFAFDLRMIRRRQADSAGPSGDQLYAVVEREQWRNVLALMPAAAAFNLAAALAIRFFPAAFATDTAYFLLGSLQLLAAGAYLVYSIKFFGRIGPLISRTRQEWRDDVLH